MDCSWPDGCDAKQIRSLVDPNRIHKTEPAIAETQCDGCRYWYCTKHMCPPREIKSAECTSHVFDPSVKGGLREVQQKLRMDTIRVLRLCKICGQDGLEDNHIR